MPGADPVTAAVVRRAALRRYPALAFLTAAGALALLLPSSLRVPLSGPPSVAELAPQPASDGSSAPGDLAELAQAGSGGLGSGNARLGSGPATSTTLAPGGSLPHQGRPRVKRCVGRPPRQTEDPMSPPCVASFDGANGGATFRGVTADEVEVVIHWQGGNETAAYRSGRLVDYAGPPVQGELAQDTAGRVWMRYFNDRYQFYGRRLRLFGYYGRGLTPEQVNADVAEIAASGAFALVPLDSLTVANMATGAARSGLVVAVHKGLPRGLYRDNAPRVLSYAPDVEDTAATAGSFICSKLLGRPARFSGDVHEQGRQRVFGLLYTDGADDPLPAQVARELERDVTQRCGLRFRTARVAAQGRDAWPMYPGALASMRTDGVTTVVAITKAGDALTYLPAASAQGWHPEWLYPQQPGTGGDDTASAQTYPQDQWAHAMVVSFDVRRGLLAEQPWVVAYRDACPDCNPPAGFLPARAYDVLSLLAYGIQAAGPRLTPAAMDKGLHAVPRRPSTDPFLPATYFDPGNWSWIKDAKAMSWDPTGRPEGNRAGCYRLAREGLRSRAGEWPAGDDDLFVASSPCQGHSQF